MVNLLPEKGTSMYPPFPSIRSQPKRSLLSRIISGAVACIVGLPFYLSGVLVAFVVFDLPFDEIRRNHADPLRSLFLLLLFSGFLWGVSMLVVLTGLEYYREWMGNPRARQRITHYLCVGAALIIAASTALWSYHSSQPHDLGLITVGLGLYALGNGVLAAMTFRHPYLT